MGVIAAASVRVKKSPCRFVHYRSSAVAPTEEWSAMASSRRRGGFAGEVYTECIARFGGRDDPNRCPPPS